MIRQYPNPPSLLDCTTAIEACRRTLPRSPIEQAYAEALIELAAMDGLVDPPRGHEGGWYVDANNVLKRIPNSHQYGEPPKHPPKHPPTPVAEPVTRTPATADSDTYDAVEDDTVEELCVERLDDTVVPDVELVMDLVADLGEEPSMDEDVAA